MIPYVGLQTNLKTDVLLSVGGDFPVARRIDESMLDYLEELDDNVYVLRMAGLDADPVLKAFLERVPGLSMNIISSESPVDNLKYKQNYPSNQIKSYNWEGTDVDINKYASLTGHDPDSHALIYSTSKLFDQNVQYERVIGSQNDFDRLKEMGCIAEKNPVYHKNQKYIINGKISLRHAPTVLNYWHMELVLYPEACVEKSKPIDNTGSGYKKNLAKCALLHYLCNEVAVDRTSFPCLDANLAIDTSVCPIKRAYKRLRRNMKGRLVFKE